MTTDAQSLPRRAVREFTSARTFDSPLVLVWKAWTERARLMQWFRPTGCTMPAAKLDFWPGGSFHYCLCAPDGDETWGRFVYREINVPERIVLVQSFSDENGHLVRHPQSPTWPLEVLTAITFSERSSRTTITVTLVPIRATEEETVTFEDARAVVAQHWSGLFEQLASFLTKPGAA